MVVGSCDIAEREIDISITGEPTATSPSPAAAHKPKRPSPLRYEPSARMGSRFLPLPPTSTPSITSVDLVTAVAEDPIFRPEPPKRWPGQGRARSGKVVVEVSSPRGQATAD
jgi:hypothetical protein